MNYTVQPAAGIESLILTIRGQRVMMDYDLAKIYGVSTMRLNEQFRRNHDRFPPDFAFQLAPDEFADLISQFAISKQRGGRRKLPWAFTEHGALMLASVLNSSIAVDASVRVVRAFVMLRGQAIASRELAHKMSELEGRISGHDEAIRNLFDAIRQLIEPPLPENRRHIGFLQEKPVPYRIPRKKKM